MLNLHQLSQDHLRSPLEDSFLILALVYMRCTHHDIPLLSAIDSAVRSNDARMPRFYADINAKVSPEREIKQLASCLASFTNILFSDSIQPKEKIYLAHQLFLTAAYKAKKDNASNRMQRAVTQNSPLYALLIETSNLLVTHFADGGFYTPGQTKVLNARYRKLKLSKKAEVNSELLPIIDTQEKIGKRQFTPPLNVIPAFFDAAPLKERAVLTAVFAVVFWQRAHPKETMDSHRLTSFCAPYFSELAGLQGSDFYFNAAKWLDIKVMLMTVQLPDEVREPLCELLEHYAATRRHAVDVSGDEQNARQCLITLKRRRLSVMRDDVKYVLEAKDIADMAARITDFFGPAISALTPVNVDFLFANIVNALFSQGSPRSSAADELSKPLRSIARQIKKACRIYLDELDAEEKVSFLQYIITWKNDVYPRALVNAGMGVSQNVVVPARVKEVDIVTTIVAAPSRPRSSTGTVMAYLNDDEDLAADINNVLDADADADADAELEVDVEQCASVLTELGVTLDPEIAAIREKENHRRNDKNSAVADSQTSLRMHSFPYLLSSQRPGSCRPFENRNGDLHRLGRSSSPIPTPIAGGSKVGFAHDDLELHKRFVY